MRIVFAAILALGPLGALAQSAENPYVLKLDRAQYALKIPGAPVHSLSAAAGSSAAYISPTPQQATPHRVPESGAMRSRERELEWQIVQLAQERDAWKMRASSLEAELRMARSAPPFLPYPPSSRP